MLISTKDILYKDEQNRRQEESECCKEAKDCAPLCVDLHSRKKIMYYLGERPREYIDAILKHKDGDTYFVSGEDKWICWDAGAAKWQEWSSSSDIQFEVAPEGENCYNMVIS